MDPSVNVRDFVEARATEISTLMQDVTSSKRSSKAWFQKLPHHMRRRAASQNPKRVPRRLRCSEKDQVNKPVKKKKKYKKKPKSLSEEYATRSTASSTWLENHIWFAKRFKMDCLWGYKLPIHSNDKKLGLSHSAATRGAMLQDLSYYPCIEISGPQMMLLYSLSLCSSNTSGHSFGSKMFLDGSREGSTILYHRNSSPYHAIGPVSFLWRPLPPSNSADPSRQLWIWCHPSCHDELVSVLVEAFQFTETEDSKADDDLFPFSCKLNATKTRQHFRREKSYTGTNATEMRLLRNTLVRLRLVGPNCLAILTDVLKLADVGSSVPVDGNGPKRLKLDSDAGPDAQDDRPSKAWWSSYFQDAAKRELHLGKKQLLELLKNPYSAYFVAPRSVFGLVVRDPRITMGFKKEMPAKFNESSVTREEFDDYVTLEMSDSPIWEKDARYKVTASKISDCEINEERSKSVVITGLGEKENRIPVLLVHQAGMKGFGSGWDLIAPLGWSREFWRALERRGGLPAGLRDLHFLNLEAGRPSFPSSYPDTLSGAAYEEKLRVDALGKHLRFPKSKRPNFAAYGTTTPFFMCWQTLVRDWATRLLEASDTDNFPPMAPSDVIGVPPSSDVIEVPPSSDAIGVPPSSDVIGVPRSSDVIGVPRSSDVIGVPPSRDVIGGPASSDVIGGPASSVVIAVQASSDVIGVPPSSDFIRVPSSSDVYRVPPSSESSSDVTAASSGDEEEADTSMKVDSPGAGEHLKFFVIRGLELNRLSSMCRRMTKSSTSSGQGELFVRLHAQFSSLVSGLSPATAHALILVKFRCLNKGRPSVHSGVFLPDDQDLENLKSNPRFNGPVESTHEVGKSATAPKKSEALERPHVGNSVSNSSRLLMGYISEGGYSRLCGQGFAVGHCSFAAFLIMLKKCIDFRLQPTVLVRDQHSFQYRPSSVEIIEDYL